MGRRSRFAFRRDKAEPAIVAALKAHGARVVLLNAKDMPDLLVGYRGATHLLEVKTHHAARTEKDGYTRRRGKTTPTAPGQEKWHASWRGGPVTIVHTPEEALAAVGVPKPDATGWWTCWECTRRFPSVERLAVHLCPAAQPRPEDAVPEGRRLMGETEPLFVEPPLETPDGTVARSPRNGRERVEVEAINAVGRLAMATLPLAMKAVSPPARQWFRVNDAPTPLRAHSLPERLRALATSASRPAKKGGGR